MQEGQVKYSLDILQTPGPAGIATFKPYFGNSFPAQLSTICLNYCRVTDRGPPLLFLDHPVMGSLSAECSGHEPADVGGEIPG